MKTSHSSRSERGSALITVISFVAVVAMLSGSTLLYTVSERRANERVRLLLRARNMAENVAVYASEQLTTKLYRLRSGSPIAFMTGSNAIHLPPDAVLDTEFSDPADVEVRAGLTSSTGLTFIDPANAANAGNPNAGLYVSTSNVPIIAKATMRHPSIGSITAYAEQDLQIAMIPLFQFGMFYNMDLELFPGQDLVITGPVHTNGRLLARGEVGGTAAVTFRDRVTAASGLYANGQLKVAYRTRAGTTSSGAGGTGPVYYSNTAGSLTNLEGGAPSRWRDQMWGGTSETSTTANQFKAFATSTYTGNVRTNVHGVTKLELPAIGSYQETNDPNTTEDDRNNGREIIAAPSLADSAGVTVSKFGRNAGLYIVVNPDDEARTGRLPNGNPISVLARSYRCFLNTVNSNGTHTIQEVVLPGQPSYGYNDNGTAADTSDDSMYQNNLPNRYTDKTVIGSNQVLRIPASGRSADNVVSVPTATTFAAAGTTTGYPTGAASLSTFPEAIFYDLRRANNNSGYPYNRSANNYIPRPIAKIDFDLTRFKLAVERTVASATAVTIYDPHTPSATNWSRSIYNPSASPASLKLGVNYGPIGGGPTITDFGGYPNNTSTTPAYFTDPFHLYFAPDHSVATQVTNITAAPSVFEVSPTALVNTGAVCPWFDGVTVYIHSVDAETRAQSSGSPQRIDSGVRLWNGRGRIATLDGTLYTNRTGFTFATNDAAYIVGHFNADGSVNATSTNNANPGGYSARYPDASDEKLACVMADAITILSQPVFNSSYVQTAGWNDSLSAHRVESTSYSSSWASSNPASSNQYEGVNASKSPGSMPNRSTAGSGSALTSKFDAYTTEISSALLVGIVPSNHNPSGLTDGPPSSSANQQYSGGAHNYPRLLESWRDISLYIRGSMVALFESRVAMEPWNLRVYQAPDRYWGLHQTLRDPAHDLPLEPIVLNAQRIRYTEITAAQYATQKAIIEALPH